ncbi:MAG: GNAT family N-acetyltransferase [Gemmatimonadetes bacterium]|nr:GNAT family N-acetyltransferase [Gemmatimonadota bacterium]MBT6144627.1 GNAT family N-acetyltransferase [Gemmatimonadota bacterium]MBT7863921.1 GNAT family N-acetyltransferase [Gemmatimonadota bacterium]
MRIEQLGLDELEPLAQLFDAYRCWYGQEPDAPGARSFLRQRMEAAESVLFGAYEADELVAFTQLYPSFSSVSMGFTWILNDLYVVETRRGAGYGRALMEAARKHASTTGAIRLDLATAHTNQTAQRLYEGLGYVMDADFRHYSLTV